MENVRVSDYHSIPTKVYFEFDLDELADIAVISECLEEHWRNNIIEIGENQVGLKKNYILSFREEHVLSRMTEVMRKTFYKTLYDAVHREPANKR